MLIRHWKLSSILRLRIQSYSSQQAIYPSVIYHGAIYKDTKNNNLYINIHVLPSCKDLATVLKGKIKFGRGVLVPKIVYGNRIQVKMEDEPVDNKVNDELVSFVRKVLVRSSPHQPSGNIMVSIRHGRMSRDKTLKIEGVPNGNMEMLQAWLYAYWDRIYGT